MAKIKLVEPSRETAAELTTIELSDWLGWYRENADVYSALQYFQDYLKIYLNKMGVKHDSSINEISARYMELRSPTLGFVCRIIMRGGILPVSSTRWLEERMNEFTVFAAQHYSAQRLATAEKNCEIIPIKPVVTKLPTIQDAIARQTGVCIGIFEQQIDKIILSNKETIPPPLGVMQNHNLKGPHAKLVIQWALKQKKEWEAAWSGSDPEMVEGYSTLSKADLKALIGYAENVMNAGLEIIKVSNELRAPRKKKLPTVAKQVKSVKVCALYAEMNLTGQSPTVVPGARVVWGFNIKNRALTKYVAADDRGLLIKGTTIKNLDTTESCTKKLRKPKITLQTLLDGTKPQTNKIMKQLTTKPMKLQERLNKQTVIVRVFK